MKVRKQGSVQGQEMIFYGSGREDLGTVPLSTNKLDIGVHALISSILEEETERW